MYTYYKLIVITGQTIVMLIHGHMYLLTSTNTISSIKNCSSIHMQQSR